MVNPLSKAVANDKPCPASLLLSESCLELQSQETSDVTVSCGVLQIPELGARRYLVHSNAEICGVSC